MKKNLEQDNFDLLRKIYQKPDFSQRQLADSLGFSLGKLNYCLSELKKKGLVKIDRFGKQKNKLKYLRYIITTKGISLRTKLTLDFMQRKMSEYEELKRELNKKKD